MSRESHQRFLRAAALREAQKAMDRKGGNALRREDLEQLRIQTVEPWKRAVVFIFGLPFFAGGVAVFTEGMLVEGVFLTLWGACFLGAAVIGRKTTVNAALDSIDVLGILRALF